MTNPTPNKSAPKTIGFDQLQHVFQGLAERGYQIIGPKRSNSAIVYSEIAGAAELPCGWTAEQDGGHYRVKPREDQAVFGYTVGPISLRRFLHPPTATLWRADRNGRGFQFHTNGSPPPKLAFLGVRACELAALAVQDKVFLQGEYADADYAARRKEAFVIAVNCTEAGGTCFCASMKTGPKATGGFDLALTEIIQPGRHFFLLESGSVRGAELAAALPCKEASEEDLREADRLMASCAQRMGRTLDTAGVKELLYRNYDNPRWEDVAGRCLSCTNCTLVCPTCFCMTVEDYTDLTGKQAERRRRWDSCFTLAFSYIVGGSVRSSARARYRQWLTHKLGTWQDQYGTSGCVGCGRCITWCPVGIDLTEEVRAMRASEKSIPAKAKAKE